MEPYKLKIKNTKSLLIIITPIIFLALIILAYLTYTHYYVFLIFLAGMLLSFRNWKKGWSTPVEIEVINNKAIFRNIFKKEDIITLADISRVETDEKKKLKFISKAKEIVCLHEFMNIDRFISDIKKENPGLIISGL